MEGALASGVWPAAACSLPMVARMLLLRSSPWRMAPLLPSTPCPPQVQKANESFLGDEQAKQQLIMRCARCGVAFASWAARASHAVASGQRRVSTAPLYTLCARPALTPLQAAGQRAGGH